MGDCLVGCCGWAEGKAKYFSRFPVVELQTTFYEPPAVSLATKWRAQAPASFHFCMKAWQLITHTPASPTYRRLKSTFSATERDFLGSFRPSEQVWLAWERTATIAQALQAQVVLFQCPASFRPETENVANMRAFFSRIKRRACAFAWEPRGAWAPELVRELCGELNLLHCVDPFQSRSVYGTPFYWRLHGKGGYSYRYSDEEVAQLALRARQEQRPGYVLFNNIWMKDDAARFQLRL